MSVIPPQDWLSRMTIRELDSPSGHLACPECRSGEFWLLPDGRIVCANEDCCNRAGWWGIPGPAEMRS